MDELNKAGAPMAMAMQSGQLQGSPVQTGVPVMAQQVVAATPLSRPMSAFGAAFNPGTPLFPGAIDPVNPVTGRAEPRITQYQVAENLMITQEPAPFGKLEWAARNVDLISRCITIRIDDITKMAWSFEISDDAVSAIMAEENCSHAKASTIARDKYADQVAEMTAAFANPFPLEYKNWRSWISQAMWDYLVYDEVVVYPNYNLGGECFGFDLIDPSTIKILRDDKGRVPQWPLPGFQQILFGYPRGEFTASPLNEVNAQFNSLEQRGPVRPSDALNVFIGHPQTKMLYGFSAVEQCLQYTDLYVNRQEWLLAEYKAGSTPAMFLETDSALELWQLADNDRILNDYYSGMTQNRQQIRSLPGGAKVVQTNQIDEKYKSDYDEFIAKRIAAIFGVAPSQVGVVSRAGLGGGKGSHDGESESAETVSTKPTINFIVDMVNTLCRQHLGMDESITFSLTDDTSSSDQMNKYKALSTAVNAGMLTLNDSRGELGMPLFDSAEADEPFVLTGSGPVFFNGQLTTNTSGETIGQTGPSSDQANQDQVPQKQNTQSQTSPSKENQGSNESSTPSPSVEAKTADKSVEAEEIREFARFVKSRNKTGKWRAFDFVAINEKLADKLNNDAYFLVKGTVPMPDSVLAWAEDVVKAQISDNTKGLATKEYNPDQPRDERGRFGSGGGADSSESKPESTDYRMRHSAPSRADDFGSPAFDISEMTPGFYENPDLYRTGNAQWDKESTKAIMDMKDNPEAKVTIYRAVPSDVSQINAGDWVTLSPSYAEQHNQSNLGGEGRVLSQEISAKDLWFNGDSINEFGYDPQTSKSINTDVIKDYNPDQPRDNHGRFGSGGGSNSFKSWDDVHAWGSKNEITIDEKSLVSNAHMTPQAMQEVAKSIDSINQKFPGMTDELKLIEGRASTGPKDTVLASVSKVDGGSKLSIGEKTGDAFANPEEYKAVCDSRIQFTSDGTPFFTSCCGNTAEDTINHELAHVVQNMNASNGTLKEPSSWGTKTNPYVAAAKDAGFLGRYDGKPTLMFQFGYQVSAYASTSPMELHAEVMSLLQRPEQMSILTTEQRTNIDTYVSSLNERAKATVIKSKSDSTSTIEDDFGRDQEFWDDFYKAIKKKSVVPDIVKGKPHPKLKDIIALAKKHKATIAAALAGSIFGVDKAIEEAIASSVTLDAAVAAKMAVDAHINFDRKKSVRMLVNVYQDGASLGQGANPSAIVGPRVQQLIERAGITIKNIDDTTQNRIYTAIKDGVLNGDNHRTISDAVNEIIDDPDRAEIIAATETNRAYNLANLDTAAENGAIGFNWITEPTACIECLTLESANPHDISELPPPEHPNCMCWFTDVYPDKSDSTGE